jgi:hypothetical protein
VYLFTDEVDAVGQDRINLRNVNKNAGPGNAEISLLYTKRQRKFSYPSRKKADGSDLEFCAARMAERIAP